MKRVGLTMRVSVDETTGEIRDALAQDWYRFLHAAIPEADWTPIPNLGERAAAHAREARLQALILTGGNTIGTFPVRDATEEALLHYALQTDTPVFGVCRGLQFIQHYFGGQVSRCPLGSHTGTRHIIYTVDTQGKDCEREVNSYHEHGIRDEELSSTMAPLARSPDGWIEAAKHRSAPITGVQWHPERNAPFVNQDIELLRRSLGFPPTTELPTNQDTDRWLLNPFSFPPCAR